jgi:hypothetical protein
MGLKATCMDVFWAPAPFGQTWAKGDSGLLATLAPIDAISQDEVWRLHIHVSESKSVEVLLAIALNT